MTTTSKPSDFADGDIFSGHYMFDLLSYRINFCLIKGGELL
jgi:hypothetical protein